MHKMERSLKGLNLRGSIVPQNIHIIESGDVAIVQNYENVTNYISGKEVQVNIRAINIFRKEGDQWKMVVHQTDLLENL